MRTKCSKILTLLLVFVSAVMIAQIQVSGVVKDDAGEPLPGAYVESESGESVETDIDGKYTITANQGEKLTFSFIGMNDIVQTVSGNSLNVTLGQDDGTKIEETVVVGYQTKSKDKITSAVSTVTSEELSNMVPSTSIDNMLQGRAAGVDATSLNGKPGSTATVRIRGAVSLNVTGGDKSSPLYVIDGAYLSEEDMNALNPNDIESISVLKDAAAAAIYGSRGANGVVIVTTKKGRKNQKASFSVTSRWGTSEKIDDPFDMMNTDQKLQYEMELGRSYSNDQLNLLKSYDHNWQDDILKKSIIQSHIVSVSGGTERSSYYYSLGYDKNTGIIQKLDGYERISAKISNNVDLSDRLRIGFDLNGSYSESQEPRDRNNVQNPFRAMYDYNPYEPVYNRDNTGNLILDADGNPTYNYTHTGFPILEALENNPEEERNLRLIGNVSLSYDLTKDLTFTTRYSATYDRYQREYLMKPGSVLDIYVGDPAAPGSKTDNSRDDYEYTFYNGLNYRKTLGNHNFDALIFGEFTQGKFYRTRVSSKGIPDGLSLQGLVPTAAFSERERFSLFSLAGVLSYDYMDKYILSASIRRDGASRFGKDNQYGDYWSASAAWNMAKENFFESVEFVDNLKLRVSYGTLGSWDIPNYAAQEYYSFLNYDGSSSAIINDNRIKNTELTWEKQKTFDLGLEYGILNNRVRGAIDYFVNTRSGFLFDFPYTTESGDFTKYLNAGEMETNGLEFELSADIIKTRDFKWTLGGNISFLDYEINNLDDFDETIISEIMILKPGEEPFTYYLPKYAGVDPANGDALYYDLEGNITNQFSSGNATTLSGKSPLPDYYGGFRTSFDYKGFNLSADFSFKHGNYIYNYMALDMLSDGNRSYANQRVDALNYWKNPGDTNVLPKPNNNSNQATDRFLQDGSYMRFRNLTFGYTFPKDLISKAGLSKFRVYVQGQNLYTWTDYEGDPEVSVGAGESQLGTTQQFVPGSFSLYSYPATKTWMFGIDLTF